MYEIVWQRSLFAIYGINIESVTIVVSAFMLGLGLGSLWGGAFVPTPPFFTYKAFCFRGTWEALFGAVSLSIFHFIAEYTTSKPLGITGIITFLLVVAPTILMGSTLPLLVEYLVRSSHNVGSSLGALYFVNTLGSGVGCIVFVRPLMSYFGQTGVVRCAAVVNALIGISALTYDLRSKIRKTGGIAQKDGSGSSHEQPFPFRFAVACSAFFGFTALSYELVWYRLLAFASADSAPVFASLLGSYLVGIALGSRFAERCAENRSRVAAVPLLGVTILASAVVSFWVGPISALIAKFLSPEGVGSSLFASLVMLFLVCHGAMLFGAMFPLTAYVSIGKDNVGTDVSYLYAANVAGSTLGVVIVRFCINGQIFPLSGLPPCY